MVGGTIDGFSRRRFNDNFGLYPPLSELIRITISSILIAEWLRTVFGTLLSSSSPNEIQLIFNSTIILAPNAPVATS